ncbi:MAG: copper resistance protein CopC [Ilumatobacteraceae bacterium]
MSSPPAVRGRTRPDRWAFGAALLVLLGTLVGWSAGSVSAHAEQLDVDPLNGSILETTPDEVVVTFNEPVSLSGGTAELFDDAGESVPVEASVTDSFLRIDLPPTLDDGTYLVAWRVISADSHPLAGTSTFSVGTPSSGGAADVDLGSGTPAAASLWRVVAMALTYGGVLVAVGTWWYSRRWHRGVLQQPDDAMTDALRRLDLWGTFAALIGALGLVIAFPARLVTVAGSWDALTDGSFVRDTITGPIGQATLVSLVGLLGLLIFRATGRSMLTLIAGLVSSLLALGGFAFEGHTRTKEPTRLLVVSDVMHTAAGAAWIAGVLALAIMLRRTTGAWRARVALDVSWTALWAVVVVSIGGLTMSVIVLPSFNALADTGYGLALMVKIGLVLVLLAIGVRSRLVLVPAIEEAQESGHVESISVAVRHLRRSVVVELFVFAMLLIATATLVGRSPVIAETTDAVIAPPPVELAPSGGTASVTINPGAVGANIVNLTLLDGNGEPLSVIEPPTLELRERTRGVGPIPLTAEDLGEGGYFAIADIPFVGTWELTVRARTGTFDSTAAVIEFTIDR